MGWRPCIKVVIDEDCISVWDNGCGMDKDRAFEFGRVGNSVNRKEEEARLKVGRLPVCRSVTGQSEDGTVLFFGRPNLSRYGIGSKAAGSFLGSVISLRTMAWGGAVQETTLDMVHPPDPDWAYSGRRMCCTPRTSGCRRSTACRRRVHRQKSKRVTLLW